MTPPRHIEDAAPYRDGPKPPRTRPPLLFCCSGKIHPSRAPPSKHPFPPPPPVGAGHARPATSPPPAVNLPPLTHSPKPSNPATFLPPTTPIICARQPPSPQYTPCPNFTLKLCRKNQKNLQKPVDKGHTTCYNNQAVSRAQPAAAAAGAFTYSLYAVF